MGLALLSIAIVAAVMLAMAVGQRLTGRCLRGSCGGPPSGSDTGPDLACDACPLRRRDPGGSRAGHAPSDGPRG